MISLLRVRRGYALDQESRSLKLWTFLTNIVENLGCDGPECFDHPVRSRPPSRIQTSVLTNNLPGAGHVSPWFQAACAHRENREEDLNVSGNETAISEPRTFHQVVPVQFGPHRNH